MAKEVKEIKTEKAVKTDYHDAEDTTNKKLSDVHDVKDETNIKLEDTHK